MNDTTTPETIDAPSYDRTHGYETVSDEPPAPRSYTMDDYQEDRRTHAPRADAVDHWIRKTGLKGVQEVHETGDGKLRIVQRHRRTADAEPEDATVAMGERSRRVEKVWDDLPPFPFAFITVRRYHGFVLSDTALKRLQAELGGTSSQMLLEIADQAWTVDVEVPTNPKPQDPAFSRREVTCVKNRWGGRDDFEALT